MKGRTGFVIGVAVGYFLGAKMGRNGGHGNDYATQIIEAEPSRNSIAANPDPRAKVQQLLSDQLRIASRRLRSSAG